MTIPTAAPAKPTSILLVEPDQDRATEISKALTEAGIPRIKILPGATGLAREVATLNPDLVLLDLRAPTRDAIEALILAASPMDRPVAMFVDQSDDALTTLAVQAGVASYVVDGLRPDRIKPVVDAAVARFHMVAAMRHELEDTRRALQERKTLDRAKGILMAARKISEDEAYALLRKSAMDQGKKLPEIARALVSAADLLT